MSLHLRRTRRSAVVSRMCSILLIASIAGCAAPKDEKGDVPASTTPSSTSAAASSVGDSGKTACPMEGDWTLCAIEDRLVHAGVVIEKQPEPAQYPFFSVPGVRYHVGSDDHQLLVFVYPSSEARETDTATLDSATASPPGAPVSWPEPPTLVVSNNLAAVILSLNDRTVERLALALSAGLPQPEKR